MPQKKGCIPWNKGKKMTSEYCETIRNAMLKFNADHPEAGIKHGEMIKGSVPWNKGKKMSEEFREKNKIAHNTPEYKEKVSGENNSMKNPEHKLNHAIAMKKLRGENHFTQKNPIGLANLKIGHNTPEYKIKHIDIVKASRTLEANNRRSESMKKVWSDPEYKERLSGENSYRYNKLPSPNAGHGKGMHIEQPNGKIIYTRSTYETRVANIFTYINVNWEHEPIGFPLNGLSLYHPDFYLPEYDLWIEVKGIWHDVPLIKATQFILQYPDKKFRILYNNDISKLEKCIDNDISIDIMSIGHALDDAVFIAFEDNLINGDISC